jgi:beta-lactamase class A
MAAVVVVAAQKPSPVQIDPVMQNLMENDARHHHGNVSLYAKALRTGQTVAIDPDVPVNTASVIKLAIMLEAMYQVKEHRVGFDDVLHLRKEDQVSGSGVLLLFRTPTEISLETAIALMITQSDNTAANLVLAHVGRENVNKRLRTLGFPVTTSIRPIGRPTEGDQSPELKPFGIGRTTAREMAGLLESIDRCDLGDRPLCAKMIDILEHQFWRNGIPHYLEDTDTTDVASHIANKTGSLNKVRNDVGIVYTKDGPIIIAAFTYDNADASWTPENEGELLIAKMARTIVDGWAPHGLGKESKPPSEPRARAEIWINRYLPTSAGQFSSTRTGGSTSTGIRRLTRKRSPVVVV